MSKVDKWVTVIDGAGHSSKVRRVDAREIEEGKARRAAEEAEANAPEVPVTSPAVVPDDEKRADGTPSATYTEAEAAAHIDKPKKGKK